MPNIKQYNAPALDIRPTETGVEARAATARRINAFYTESAGMIRDTGQRLGSSVRDAGDAYVAYQEHREISAGAAKFAELGEGLTNAWNERAKSADPNDQSVAGKFREEVMEPAFQKFNDAFTTQGGQNWAQSHTASMRQHMFTKQAADMSTLAAHAIHVNADQTVNKLSSTVYGDPSGVDWAVDTFKTSIAGVVDSSPRLTPAQAAQVKNELAQKGVKQIVHAAISGTIANGGDWEKIAGQYKEYIDRPTLERFVKAEQAQQRADRLAQKQLELYGKQQATEAAHELLSKNMTDNVTFDDTGRASIKPDFYKNVMDIERQFPGMATERSRAMINWGQSQQRERKTAVVSNADVKSDLMTRMFDPNNPTTETDILSAAARDELSAHDRQNLSALLKSTSPLKGPIYQGAMSAAKEALGHNLLADGADRYSNFLQTFIPEYTKQLRAGALPPNALNTRDPESLISKTLDQFRPTQQQLMTGRMLKNFGVVNPSDLPSRTLDLRPGSPDRGEGGPPTVRTQEEFDALPPGAKYRNEKGRLLEKPKK